MSDNSDIPYTSNNQHFSSLSQNDNRNGEASFESSPNKIVPKTGSSTSELRSSLKHALQILDKMQTENENYIDDNLNRNLNILNSNQENKNLSKSEKLASPRTYKIIRRKKFVPYRGKNENSQDKTEVSLFLETTGIDSKNANKPSNINIDNLQFTTRDVNLLSDIEENSVDLDELAYSLGLHLNISEKEEDGEMDTNFSNVSDIISRDPQGNDLQLGDRMKRLDHLITVAENDLNTLVQTEEEVNNT